MRRWWRCTLALEIMFLLIFFLMEWNLILHSSLYSSDFFICVDDISSYLFIIRSGTVFISFINFLAISFVNYECGFEYTCELIFGPAIDDSTRKLLFDGLAQFFSRHAPPTAATVCNFNNDILFGGRITAPHERSVNNINISLYLVSFIFLSQIISSN